jgi:hypothetical protein
MMEGGEGDVSAMGVCVPVTVSKSYSSSSTSPPLLIPAARFRIADIGCVRECGNGFVFVCV